MKNIFETARTNALFQGIESDVFEKMYSCLSARSVRYHKDEVILLSGDEITVVGLVLSGAVRILKEDLKGNTTILAVLSVSELFGEVFACAGVVRSPVTVTAAEKCEILLIDYRKIITSCPCACPFHIKLIENMLNIIAQKNILLNEKNELLSKRTIREKLLCLFARYQAEGTAFTIPYNREEMAQYLCVDRSALSNELCKMREEGLITFSKNRFELLYE